MWGDPPSIGGESFEQYAMNGIAANIACCDCGGGTTRSVSYEMSEIDEGGQICNFKDGTAALTGNPPGAKNELSVCTDACLARDDCKYVVRTNKGYCRLLTHCNSLISKAGDALAKVEV